MPVPKQSTSQSMGALNHDAMVLSDVTCYMESATVVRREIAVLSCWTEVMSNTSVWTEPLQDEPKHTANMFKIGKT